MSIKKTDLIWRFRKSSTSFSALWSRACKYFWSYIKKCKKSFSILSHVSYKDRLSNSDREASDLFASFFGSVYCQSWRGPTNLVFDQPTCFSSIIRVDFKKVEKAIKEAPNSPNYGQNLIPFYFIKRCDPSFVKHLVVLFSKSLESGVHPNAWKLAFIQPIHKKGNNT